MRIKTSPNSAPDGANFIISVPSDYEKVESGSDYSFYWDGPNYEETNCMVNVQDVDPSITFRPIMYTTFEDWSTQDLDEKIFFEYKDGDKYEEYTVLVIQQDTMQALEQKVNAIDVGTDEANNENSSEATEIIKECYGEKLIVNKTSPSKSIKVMVRSNDMNDAEEFKKILNSFKWKES